MSREFTLKSDAPKKRQVPQLIAFLSGTNYRERSTMLKVVFYVSKGDVRLLDSVIRISAFLVKALLVYVD